MGETVEFPSNGTATPGYLARPGVGAGLGLVVIGERWGLVDHIRDVCDRFAAEGFTALAPDLYRGGATRQPDEAAALMTALDLERAARDLSGAVSFLARHEAVRGRGVGVVGFGTGGGLALWLGTVCAEDVRVAVPFYGVIPWEAEEGAARPDYRRLRAAVQGHYAELDASAPPEKARALEDELRSAGVDVEMHLYAGARHAFFDDARPDVHDEDAARQAWIRTLEFLRKHLG